MGCNKVLYALIFSIAPKWKSKGLCPQFQHLAVVCALINLPTVRSTPPPFPSLATANTLPNEFIPSQRQFCLRAHNTIPPNNESLSKGSCNNSLVEINLPSEEQRSAYNLHDFWAFLSLELLDIPKLFSPLVFKPLWSALIRTILILRFGPSTFWELERGFLHTIQNARRNLVPSRCLYVWQRV